MSSEGVQRDLLPILEGSSVSTKYGPVSTDHVLFIASGAFHVAKVSDLLAELQVGRRAHSRWALPARGSRAGARLHGCMAARLCGCGTARLVA